MTMARNRLSTLGDVLSLEEASKQIAFRNRYHGIMDVQATREMNDLSNKITLALESAEDVTDDIVTLSNIKNRLKRSIANNKGITDKSANIIKMSLSNISRRNGIELKNQVSTENFTDATSRLNSTKALLVSIEEGEAEGEGFFGKIKAVLVAIWNKIKEWWGMFINFITGKSEDVKEGLEETKKMVEEKLPPKALLTIICTKSTQAKRKAIQGLEEGFNPDTLNPVWMEKNWATKLVGKIKPLRILVNKCKGLKGSFAEQQEEVRRLIDEELKEQNEVKERIFKAENSKNDKDKAFAIEVKEAHDVINELNSLVNLARQCNTDGGQIGEITSLINEMLSNIQRHDGSEAANKQISPLIKDGVQKGKDKIALMQNYLKTRNSEIRKSAAKTAKVEEIKEKVIKKLQKSINLSNNDINELNGYIQDLNRSINEGKTYLNQAEQMLRSSKPGSQEYIDAQSVIPLIKGRLSQLEKLVEDYRERIQIKRDKIQKDTSMKSEAQSRLNQSKMNRRDDETFLKNYKQNEKAVDGKHKMW